MIPQSVCWSTTTWNSLYSADSLHLRVQAADMNILASTFMRALGEAVGSFALECAVDELAERLGMDPVELRLLNEPESDPISGTSFSGRHSAEAFRQGAERFGWERRGAPGARRDGERLVGMGVAAACYSYKRFPGGAAHITLTTEGHATVEVAAHDMGMGTETAQMQVCADRLGLPMERVTFRYGDSRLAGNVQAGGSQQTAAICANVIAAHDTLMAELIKLAGNDSPLAGLKAAELSRRRSAHAGDRPHNRFDLDPVEQRCRRQGGGPHQCRAG